jgi:hypothetical protein
MMKMASEKKGWEVASLFPLRREGEGPRVRGVMR